MLSRLKSTLLHLSLIGVMVFSGASLHAAVEKVGLKLGGKPIPKLGKKYCKPPGAAEEIEVLLTPKLKEVGNFRYRFGKVKENTGLTPTTKAEKIESGCDPTVPEGTGNMKDFNTGKPNIPARIFLPDNACDEKNGAGGTRVLCIYEKDDKDLVAYAEFSFDTRVAHIIDTSNKVAIDGEISFTVNHSRVAGSIEIEVCYVKQKDDKDGNIKKDGCPEDKGLKSFITSSNPVTIPGLTNHEKYDVKVRIPEEYNGDGKWSTPFTETPVPAASFLNVYNGNGGDFEFSCQQGGSSSLIFLAIILMASILLRRRNQPKIPTGLFLAIILLHTVLKPEIGHATLGQMNIGILGAMYRPDLDNERLSSGKEIFPCYKCLFRKKISDQNGPINPLMGAEIDWHLWDGFGSLQLGFGVSYTFVRGRMVELKNNGQPDCDIPIEGTKVSLHMYQLRPQLTYIFNPFAEYFPFVPYIRGALIGHGYSIFKQGKNEPPVTVGAHTRKPNGFRFGYQAAVGLMLMLDFLEPSAVKAARGEGLFDHVYLKGELSYTKIDDFGRPGFQFSAKDVMGTGLPLMWTFGLVFELPQ